MNHTPISFLPRVAREAFGLALLLVGLVATAAPVRFDISKQPAETALPLFIKQSGAQVTYVQEDVRGTTANAVTGEHETEAALELLVKDTGLIVAERRGGWFTIRRAAAEKAGSIEGQVRDESGKPVPGARVSVVGSYKEITTDRRGRFFIESVPAGAQAVSIYAEGMQKTRVTDVIVKPGHRHTLSSITVPAAVVGVTQLEDYIVSAKKNDGVVELDPYEVTGVKEKPFTGRSVDLPRTVNEVQPYFIFDSETISRSGALNVEDFLKQRLTMNTTALTAQQNMTNSNLRGATSSIDLRGLGPDKTLVLVNGRRMAGVKVEVFGSEVPQQPDVNGLPLSAIDRIEVLPSSASGIYGGGAIGGVVNIILREEYHGGELRLSYENSDDTDAPNRAAALSYGLSLEGGRTHVMVNAQWTEVEPLQLRDRREIFERNFSVIQTNSPTLITSATIPFLGATPNIKSTFFFDTATRTFFPDPGTLTLRNGAALNSGRTFVPIGTAPDTSSDALANGLLANAGQYNFDLPESTQSPTGLMRSIGALTRTESVQATIRRKMTSSLEAFAEVSYAKNHSAATYNPLNSGVTVGPNAPNNPFTSAVQIRFPSNEDTPIVTDSFTRSATVGMKTDLPLDWIAQFDVTWSQNRHTNTRFEVDPAIASDFASGVLNPFIDTLSFPLSVQSYLYRNRYSGNSNLTHIALRGSGPLPAVPLVANNPTLTLGFEHRIARTPEHTYVQRYPVSTTRDRTDTYLEREQTTDSAYAEIDIPVLSEGRVPGIRGLSFQLSGRGERYAVGTGTQLRTTLDGMMPPVVEAFPTRDGVEYSDEASYTSRNFTVGFKLVLPSSFVLRASQATAFLPPTPSQLHTNPIVDLFNNGITSDPANPDFTGFLVVPAITGGNPNLRPQNSRSTNAGIIWSPSIGQSHSFRVNAEYYRIEQFDVIASLSAQTLVNSEQSFPGRVTRDAQGMVSQVDLTMVNLFQRQTQGFDLSLDYRLRTNHGSWNLSAIQTTIVDLKEQYAANLPEFQAAGYSPAERGAPKHKRNIALTWERGIWSAGWTVRHISAYRQYGAAGGPISTQSFGGKAYPLFIAAQGSDHIESQTYHDFTAGFSIPSDRRQSAFSNLRSFVSGIAVQVGIRNVFDKPPPLDANYSGYFYMSPLGNHRLRSYWINVRKDF